MMTGAAQVPEPFRSEFTPSPIAMSPITTAPVSMSPVSTSPVTTSPIAGESCSTPAVTELPVEAPVAPDRRDMSETATTGSSREVPWWRRTIRSHKPLDQHCLTLLQVVRSRRRTETGQVIGFTGCRAGDGVSAIAANVAVCAARVSEKPVLLVDAHAEDPAVASRFRLARGPGWSDALSGRHDVLDCLQHTRIGELWAIVSRKQRQATAQAYNTTVAARLIADLRRRFDLIVVDLPPATEQTNCLATAAALDGVVMVVESERVRAEAARRVRENFERAGINLVGVVLNKRRDHVPGWLYRRL